MGIHADDARDEEEDWADMRAFHKSGLCKTFDYCPYCDPDFVPFFEHQAYIEEVISDRLR